MGRIHLVTPAVAMGAAANAEGGFMFSENANDIASQLCLTHGFTKEMTEWRKAQRYGRRIKMTTDRQPISIHDDTHQ
jgi:hypothetical protein